MTQRSRDRDRRGARAESSAARRPVRARRETTGRTTLRRGLSAKRASGAAKVLGMSNTRRAAVVAIVVCALAFTIAVPLRTYLTQKSEVTVQEQKRAELQQEVANLQARQNQLRDPAQIEAEARKRLRYVMPGETPYMVQLPEDKAQPQAPQPGQQPAPQGAWYERLWHSITG
ncbi:septum formation initiator family protein [Amycolatopsis minnesotensis]|uniref:Septum formation initiator n=1 Tax=Amycolatopsis minnesotensis TaxID=337894 RepID=A0ABN2R3X0_9PSEU